MDDNLERPTSKSQLPPAEHPEDEQSSGDEDQGPDWTKLPSVSGPRPVIPKRGEKDFEPIAAGGSGYQRHVLDRSRSAMFDALRAAPSISSKSASHAVWYPELARAHVTIARGVVVANMGHSVARPSLDPGVSQKVQKRLELLPEEALYLIERGALFCRKAGEPVLAEEERLDEMEGAPMSVQQAFAEMIGKEDLTLEKYQVYAYLKRLGYAVTRAKPPTSEYPVPTPYPSAASPSTTIFARLRNLFRSFVFGLRNLLLGSFDWRRPIKFSRWLHHNMDYTSLSKSLRFLPSGHDVPLHIKTKSGAPPSPYEIFYHLYKPSTPFKKTAPPPPDFSVVVVNARTTPIPSLHELSTLFGVLPELPPPVPRKRQAFTPGGSKTPTAPPPVPTSVAPSSEASSWRKLFQWAPSCMTKQSSPEKAQPQAPRTNPFLALKTGNKIIVIAAVDAGTTTFFRFGQGVFKEWPML
ncbi:hypothetical protein OBBRIDRAFT_834612 [Obba rivulosa]|uniref:tRNA-splicing endonuclease subunit Sen54 N-terminal domain-containing protein n=1 Tax=Obba rivulosa TaxID=1052685 RepID=A0A8E2AXD3_9APHY|nr:hypothetical protein OBBRIDRAFT_834612 [Obba rivulosa]